MIEQPREVSEVDRDIGRLIREIARVPMPPDLWSLYNRVNQLLNEPTVPDGSYRSAQGIPV